MSTENFIDSIVSGNSSDANNAFKDIINTKISDALASRKIELANAVYNGVIDQQEIEAENEFQAAETESDGSFEQADQED